MSFSEQKERTEALVITPLTQLLNMFAGPHKLVLKRRDKLLDYDNCKERAERLKDKRVQEELQAARNNYEALNAQLLDEMPKFHHAAEELFTSCVRGFAQAQRDFISLTVGELKPLLKVRKLSTELSLFSLVFRFMILCFFPLAVWIGRYRRESVVLVSGGTHSCVGFTAELQFLP